MSAWTWVVAVGAGALGVFDVVWNAHFRERGVIGGDESGYLAIAATDARALTHGGPGSLVHTFISQRYEAPFVPLVAGMFEAVFGRRPTVGIEALGLFAAVLVLATYGVARRLVAPPWAALAAFLAGCMPAVLAYGRFFEFAVPSAAVMTAGLWALLRSDGLAGRWWAVLFGALVGLAALTRTMTLAYLPGLAVACLLLVVCRRRAGAIVNLVLAALAAAIVAGVWYLPNLRTVGHYLLHFGYGSEASTAGPAHSIASWSYWSKELSLVVDELGVILAAVVAVGFVWGTVLAVRAVLALRTAHPAPPGSGSAAAGAGPGAASADPGPVSTDLGPVSTDLGPEGAGLGTVRPDLGTPGAGLGTAGADVGPDHVTVAAGPPAAAAVSDSAPAAVAPVAGGPARGRAGWSGLLGSDAAVLVVVVAEGYLALTSSRNLGTGFALAWLPALVVLAVAGLARLPVRWLRVGSAAVAVGGCSLAVVSAATVSSVLSDPVHVAVPGLGHQPVVDGRPIVSDNLAQAGYPVGPVTDPVPPAGWYGRIRSITGILLATARQHDRPVVVASAVDVLYPGNAFTLAAVTSYGATIHSADLLPGTEAQVTSTLRSNGADLLVVAAPTTYRAGDPSAATVTAAARAAGVQQVRRLAEPDAVITIWWR